MPSNSNHFSQLLNRVYFHVAKDIWTDEVTEWRTQNLGILLQKRTFAPLSRILIAKKQENPTLILNGFKCCGLCSFLLENLDLMKVSLSVQEDEIQTNPKETAEIQIMAELSLNDRSKKDLIN